MHSPQRVYWILIGRNGGRETCHYCGVDIHRGDNRDRKHFGTIDHLMPISKGGTNALDNLALACVRCNHDKGAKSYERFILQTLANMAHARANIGRLLCETYHYRLVKAC